MTDRSWPVSPDDWEAAELLWSARQSLPEREIVAPETVRFEDAFSSPNTCFRFTGWGDRPLLSHARVLYRDALREPVELRDLWVPHALIRPEKLARAEAIEDLDLTRRGGPSARPYRVTEWVHSFEPYERDRIVLELDEGRLATSITGVYRDLADNVLAVGHRWVLWPVLTFARNLLWERAARPNLHPPEDHPWPPPWRAEPIDLGGGP